MKDDKSTIDEVKMFDTDTSSFTMATSYSNADEISTVTIKNTQDFSVPSTFKISTANCSWKTFNGGDYINVNEIIDMCDHYPTLKYDFERFLLTYNLVIDNYKNRKESGEL